MRFKHFKSIGAILNFCVFPLNYNRNNYQNFKKKALTTVPIRGKIPNFFVVLFVQIGAFGIPVIHKCVERKNKFWVNTFFAVL